MKTLRWSFAFFFVCWSSSAVFQQAATTLPGPHSSHHDPARLRAFQLRIDEEQPHRRAHHGRKQYEKSKENAAYQLASGNFNGWEMLIDNFHWSTRWGEGFRVSKFQGLGVSMLSQAPWTRVQSSEQKNRPPKRAIVRL